MIAALGVLQGAQLVLPTIAPPFLYNILVIIALVGLPTSIALAWIFDLTPEGLRRTTSSTETSSSSAAPPRNAFAPVLTGIIVLAALMWGGWFVMHPKANVNDGIVAVLPFRVSGDGSLHYLREGMVDLLNARLSDDPHAVDARTMFAAWRRAVPDTASDLSERDAIKFARGLGAGRVLLGTVVGTGSRLTLTGKLMRANGRSVESGPIEGSVDSVTVLVDRLLAAVLSLDAGEKSNSIASLTSTSLPALRAYLSGRAFDRRGRYPEAVQFYNAALQIDSTFALAAMNNAEAADMLFNSTVRADPRSTRLALAFQDRLSSDDRAYVNAAHSVGNTSIKAMLDKWEDAVKALPDRPEAWYHFGDLMFHNGAEAGYNDNLERAEAALKRAVQLDSLYATPIMHLQWLGEMNEDSAAMVRYATLFLRIEKEGNEADFARRAVLIANRDTAGLRTWIDAISAPGTPVASRRSFALFDQIAPKELFKLDMAQRASDFILKAATTTAENSDAHNRSARLALNAGRPTAALEHRLQAGGPAQGLIILDALFGDGDTIAARIAAEKIATSPDATRPEVQRRIDTYAAQVWRLSHGDARGTDAVIAQLRAPYDSANGPAARRDSASARLIDAFAAIVTKQPDALRKTLSVDSVLALGVAKPVGANLLSARLLEMVGRDGEALAAARRMNYNTGGDQYRSTFVRERARLAAKLGYADEAKKFYRQYLLLRSNPEQSLVGERDRIRA
ncbi:MAG TPA: hypothetical protein VM100_04400, partial [Longimicrobiales bacterium]|nr:hypothetical protein [Longimicrobiales bacterium]